MKRKHPDEIVLQRIAKWSFGCLLAFSIAASYAADPPSQGAGISPTAIERLRASNNLVYLDPPVEGSQGWLLGDGAAGATVWNPAEGISIQFGHTDLLESGPNTAIYREMGGAGSDQAAHAVVNRHAAQSFIKIGDAPLFDPYYLKSYRGELDLQSGKLSVAGESVLGTFEFSAYFAEEPGVFYIEYKDELDTAQPRSFQLQRYGSRTLFRSYSRSVGKGGDGLSQTKANQPNENILTVSDDMQMSSVATAVRFQASADHWESRNYEKGIEVRFPATRSFSLKAVYSIAVTENSANPLDVAMEQLAQVTETPRLSEGAARKTGEKFPHDIFVHLPEDPYYEQLWHLARYHLQSSYYGKHPPFFINGPWGWMRDNRMWANLWFHWNMHGASLPLSYIGEEQALSTTYTDYKTKQIPGFRKVTKDAFGTRGAAFNDQQLPNGNVITNNAKKEFLAPGLQASLQLYERWRIWGDDSYLEQELYPYLRANMLFWRDYLEEDGEGRLHVPRSTPYEFHGDYAFKDALTEQSHLRSFLPAFADAARRLDRDSELAEWAESAATRLADFQTILMPLAFVTSEGPNGRYYNNPFFYGDKAANTDELLAIGISEKEDRWVSHVETHFDGESRYGVFNSAQTSHIFPSPLLSSDASPEWADRVGASAADRDLWEMGVNALRTIRRYPSPENQDADMSAVAEPNIAWSGHALELPAFARMGLVEPLRKAMDYYIDRYQMFPQGMWNYHPRKRWQMFGVEHRNEEGEMRKFPYDPWMIHFAMEPQGIFTQTVNLMLLDSMDETLRPFQAYDKDAVFRLPARGGFIVTAEQKEGTLKRVDIHSLRGEALRIRLPWTQVAVSENGGTPQQRDVRHAILEMETAPGEHYTLTPDSEIPEYSEIESGDAEPKLRKRSTLGLFKRMQ